MRLLIWLAIPLASVASEQHVSKTGRCGPNFGLTCEGSRFGDCCSQFSFCGSADAYCHKRSGCQAGWGTCNESLSSCAKPSSTSTGRISSTLRTSSRTASSSLRSSTLSAHSSASTRSPSSSSRLSTSSARSSTSSRSSSFSSRLSTSSARSSSTSSRSFSISSRLSSSSSPSSASSTINRPSSPSLSSSIRVSSTARSSSTPDISSSASSLTSILASSSITQLSSTSEVLSSTAQSSSVTPIPSPSELPSPSPLLSSSTSSSSSSSSTVVSVSTDYNSGVSSITTSSPEMPSPVSSSIFVSISSSTDESVLASSSSATITGSSSVSLSTSETQDFTSSSFTSLDSSISESVTSSTLILGSDSSPSDGATLTLSSTSSTMVISVTTTESPSQSVQTSSTEPESLSSTQISAFTSSNLPSTTSDSASTSASFSTSIPASEISSPSSTSQETSTLTISFTTSESASASASSSVNSDVNCTPKPSPTCDRSQDCPVSTNAMVSPSATYSGIPVVYATGLPYRNISVPINDLTVGNEYVLTFYGSENSLLGSGSHSCCNLTAYMDDVAISQYCVGYYWSLSYSKNGPYADSRSNFPRSPAVVYRPAISNPALTFNVVCPDPAISQGITVGTVAMYGVSLVPRCTCQEEDTFESLQSQPLNIAWNGNFADYDLTQENPVSGWTSQENWKNQVIPVQYAGPYPADDASNSGSVVLHGGSASLYRSIANLSPSAPYNVSILWRENSINYPGCNTTVKFNDEIIMEIPRLQAYTNVKAMIRNSTTFYPRTTSGILWVGSACTGQLIYNMRTQFYPSARIDDVSFTPLSCSTTGTLSIGDDSTTE
ncbi:hypothetical protein BU16DRAFT_366469 [Lophium mytilinum]|uniref:Chitin-binding type-1 domain-containing protein n=1 Tax=Lophium mytilinum TaxID=390894 RepID=A0A6A6QW25_9PEZI|nr:hypothetical protein BU16DRAFT_366469 [Lophium mytilinum]